jgi:hypothetical protein
MRANTDVRQVLWITPPALAGQISKSRSMAFKLPNLFARCAEMQHNLKSLAQRSCAEGFSGKVPIET